MRDPENNTKRLVYANFTPEQKSAIEKQAAERSVAATNCPLLRKYVRLSKIDTAIWNPCIL